MATSNFARPALVTPSHGVLSSPFSGGSRFPCTPPRAATVKPSHAVCFVTFPAFVGLVRGFSPRGYCASLPPGGLLPVRSLCLLDPVGSFSAFLPVRKASIPKMGQKVKRFCVEFWEKFF